MADLIARLYASGEQASVAVTKLKEAGFADDSIGQLHPTPERTDEGSAGVAAPTSTLERYLASTYGKQLEGRWLVGVEAPWGRGVLATNVLESAGPVAERLPEPSGRTDTAVAADSWGEAAPLSQTLGFAVLSSDPAPLSSMFGWAIKAKREYFLTAKLRSEAAPLSSRLGLPTLTKRRHFLVSGLSNNAAPLSSKLGLRLLSDNAAPLSSRLGWPLLKKEAAPLSSKLGMPLLTDKQ